ncbi:MAG TPA: hypothetical protein VHC94_00320 [Nitrobacter sp.]|nr:hypothetical protein [Nitrobacter sp.]
MSRVLPAYQGAGVVMPIFRYFVVMGGCLLALLFVADYVWPDAGTATSQPARTVANAESGDVGSLADLRRSEDRLERSRHESHAIVYPDVASLAPTTQRLQWEQQLRYLPADHVYEASAEPAKTAEPVKTAEPKVAERTRPIHKRVAHARPDPRQADPRFAANVLHPPRSYFARNSGWDPFGLFD